MEHSLEPLRHKVKEKRPRKPNPRNVEIEEEDEES